jgi:phosphate transport system protein
MREIFHGQLAALGAELSTMCGLVCAAMERATRALLDTELVLAEQVITGDAEIDHRGARCEEHACTLLALQAPVAGDLRTVVMAIRVCERIARMGDLARHIAEIARLRHPHCAVPAELIGQFADMGALAIAACRDLEHLIAAPTGTHTPAQERADDHIDRLHRLVLEMISHADPPHPIQTGVDVALLARYFERFADQAVAITRQLDFVVTGEMPPRSHP